MYKKIVSSILILALLSQVGCYSMNEMTKEEVINNKDYDNLTILIKNSRKYKFEKPDFYIVDDTLKGKAGKIDADTVIRDYFDANIPLSDIEKFETSEYDGTKTWIFVGVSILVVVGIFLIAFKESMSDFNPNIKF